MNAIYGFFAQLMSLLISPFVALCNGNYAIAIFAFTIIINVLFLPANFKQQKASAQQARLRHKMEKLKSWYPGDEYCDVIGADTYDIEINHKLYRKISRITNALKPFCLHECGQNPTADDFRKRPWSYFMTWHTEYLTDRNSDKALYDLYNSDSIITLDELHKTEP